MRNKALSVLIINLLFFFQSSIGQTIQISGELSGLLEADTILLVGNVDIPAGETLQFRPGSNVVATAMFGFNVMGSISAMGNTVSPIIFTVSDTTGFHNLYDSRGGWNGFHFINTPASADSSVFSFCNFEFGKAIGDSIEEMGGVFNIRNFDKIRISDCNFSYNKAVYWGGAIFAEYSNLKISNSTFIGNFCGIPSPPYGYGGAICLRYSAADITGCHFTENKSTGIGGAVSFEYADVLLQTNIFENNYSALGGALGYLRSNPTRSITGNLFTGNSANFFGGAISCNKANPHFINNTIANNSCASYGGGFYCNDSAVPVVINSIIYGNYAPSGEQVYIWDIYSAPEFYYSNIEGGYLAFGGTGGTGFNSPYVNNIDSLPAFSGLLPHPYSLSNESPCINAGNPDTTGLMIPLTDLAGNIRYTGSSIDIGAYENTNGASGIFGFKPDFEVSCTPNPFRDKLSLSFPNPENKLITIRISDLSGNEIFTFSGSNSGQFDWDGKKHISSTLKPGAYLVSILIGNKTGSAIIIHVK